MADKTVFHKLNARVELKVSQLRNAHEQDPKGCALPPEVECVARKMTPLWCGSPVYVPRSHTPVYFFTAAGMAMLCLGLWHWGVLVGAICFFATFLVYDAYSGVLHIMLDDPTNLSRPIIGQPCLEFQWHHHIPDDIVIKPFMESCADLNLAVGLSFVTHLGFMAYQGSPNTLVLMLLGLKMMTAYFGQFSHRSAHQSLSNRGPVVRALQRHGVITSYKQHRAHHTPPHDKNFCLIGPCNDFVAELNRFIPGTNAWLALFLVWSVFDVYVVAGVLNAVLGAEPAWKGTQVWNAANISSSF